MLSFPKSGWDFSSLRAWGGNCVCGNCAGADTGMIPMCVGLLRQQCVSSEMRRTLRYQCMCKGLGQCVSSEKILCARSRRKLRHFVYEPKTMCDAENNRKAMCSILKLCHTTI